MKLSRSLTFLWADDEDAFERLFETTSPLSQIVDDEDVAAQSSVNAMDVGASSTLAIPFGSVVTANRVLVIVDKDVSLKLNGSADAIVVKPLGKSTDRTDRGVFYFEGPCTAIQVVNAGSASARVVYALAGV